VTRKAPPPPGQAPDPATSASFTLTDADITSQRAVPRTRLPGVLGARAAAAFGGAGPAPTADHDGPSNDPGPAGNRRPVQRKTADAD
jgi:hypothetical protein